MEFLEFLIQKEGDRSWLPLDSPEAEILEGRYRVMARCDRGNAPVDIRITYLDLEAVPPRRRVHNVTRPTTDRGLLAVMPFSPLSTGTWTLRCAAPVNAHEKPEWHYTLQLQVLEENAHHEADFEPEFDPETLNETTSRSLSEDQTTDVESSPPEAPSVSQGIHLIGEEHSTESNETELDEIAQDEAQDDLLQDPWSSNVHAVQAQGGEAAFRQEDVSDRGAEARGAEARGAAAFNSEGSSDRDDFDLDAMADAGQPEGDELEPAELEPDAVISKPEEHASAETQAPLADILSDVGHPESVAASAELTVPEDLEPDHSPLNLDIEPPAADLSAEALSFDAEMSDETSPEERAVPSQSPTSLPAEWENLPLDMQQEMAQMFQAVDDMAADILASMNQRFESIFPNSSTASPPELPVSDSQDLRPQEAEPQAPEPQGLESQVSEFSPSDASPTPMPSGDAELPEVQSALSLPQEDSRLSQSNITSDESSEALPSVLSPPSDSAAPQKAQVAAAIPNVELRLAQDAFSVGRGQPLTVRGHIVAAPSSLPQALASPRPSVSSLNVVLTLQLTDPQTGAVQAETHQPLTLSASEESQTSFEPLPFEIVLNLAPTVQTYLLLGEAVLSLDENLTGEPSPQPENSTAPISLILASYGFVVTLEMDALLGAIAQPSEMLSAIDPPLAFVEPDEEPAQATPTEHLPPRPLRVSNQLNLPPQLYDAEADDAVGDRPPLDLPEFVKSSTAIAPGLLYLVGLSHLADGSSDSDGVEGKESESKDAEAEDSDIKFLTSGDSDGDADGDSDGDAAAEFLAVESPVLDEAAEFTDDAEAFSDQEAVNRSSEAGQAVEAEADSLDFSEDFSEKSSEDFSETGLDEDKGEAELIPNPFTDGLQGLELPSENVGEFQQAHAQNLEFDPFELDSGELEAIALSSSIAESESPPESASPASAVGDVNGKAGDRTHPVHQPSYSLESEPGSLESQPGSGSRVNDDHNEYQAAPAAAPPTAEEITIPVPQLYLAEDELVAGQSVRMSVTLPELPVQVFVKLWVQDRQTRTLLDGPRWIADFIADGAGSTEARIQFTVPLGCVEMRIEAIAVDVLSQRESHKTSIDRLVVPPDLPALSLDDFN